MTVQWRRGNEHGQFFGTPPVMQTPAIVLCDPKYPHNVGQIVRLAACYGIPQVWITGDRVKLADTIERIPREERMRDYNSVTLFKTERPMDHFGQVRPEIVCIEFVPNSENLCLYEHTPNSIYVFGPEDGGVPKAIRVLCWRFVKIPTLHCLNLATAVATVLYDRHAKVVDPLGLASRRSGDGDGIQLCTAS